MLNAAIRNSLPGMMTDTFSLKFQICDCFLLVFCFLLYFQDLCLRVLMLSYNAKIRSFLHVYSILFHPQINTTVSSPLSKTENSYSSVLSRAIGLHMSVNRPIAPVPPLVLVPQGSTAVGQRMFVLLLEEFWASRYLVRLNQLCRSMFLDKLIV